MSRNDKGMLYQHLKGTGFGCPACPSLCCVHRIANQFPNPWTHINVGKNWSSFLQETLGNSCLAFGSFGWENAVAATGRKLIPGNTKYRSPF